MRIIAIAGLLAVCAPAMAGERQGAACAARLSDVGRTFYSDAAPKVASKDAVRAQLRSTAVRLVMSGQIQPDKARSEAHAAADCIRKLRS